MKLSIKSLLFLVFIFNISALISQIDSKSDSIARAKAALMKSSKVEYSKKSVKLTIQNIDISNYPTVKIIVEAFNVYGEPLDTLYANNLTVVENGIEKKVIAVEKISVNERIPIDFVFVIDKTATMQSYMDAIKQKISGMCSYLKSKGIDYRIGLILFSDEVEKVFQPTTDVNEFLKWISKVRAEGGDDIKENALEALATTATMQWRPSANRVALIVTDAPFHQKGENGKGKTNYTTETITSYLNQNDIRLFAIVPPRITNYNQISQNTRGNSYDIDYPFSAILDNFSNQLTNLFALKYKTEKPAIPDSIDIAIINEKKQELTKKTIAVVELGRKLIIENLLYSTGKAELPGKVRELDVLTEFMINKKNVQITIEGHTDNVGSDGANQRLSLSRAEAVRQYLIKKGLNGIRVKTKGYGSKRPIASNMTDFGRKLNRRTEIIITGK